MGQVLSTKINPNGLLVCNTTIVSGNYLSYTATDNGQWNVYQNGVFITSLSSDLIEMGTVQLQVVFALLEGE